eukprot:scaffold374_cov94-Skeletonema_dohrnii-CCMP3373.AAC.2
MADQNLATVKSTPIFTMVNTRVSIGKPVSPNDELFNNRLNHIKSVWMQNDPYFLRVLLKEGITTWSGFASFAKNPDEINSVKNRNQINEEDDDGEEDEELTQYWKDRSKYP